jgi:hypothetical protein
LGVDVVGLGGVDAVDQREVGVEFLEGGVAIGAVGEVDVAEVHCVAWAACP